MKKNIASMLMLLLGISASLWGQGTIPISFSAKSSDPTISQPAQERLSNRLKSFVRHPQLKATTDNTQFAIIAQMITLEQLVSPGAPVKMVGKYQITLELMDRMSGLILAQSEFSTSGVGPTELKAQTVAISNISPQNDRISTFINQSVDKINDYYDREYPTFLRKASLMENRKEYSTAMFLLNCIPSSCKGYEQATEAGNRVYEKYLNESCKELVMAARRSWISDMTKEGAKKALDILGQIHPSSGCSKEVEELLNEIKSKNIDSWDLEVKKYNDQIELRKSEIDAWREVGIAFGNNQPDTIIRSIF